MVTLEDILESYGAATDFWATASNADRDPGQDESWDYEALLETYRDPQDLCGLGCLFLQRYGVDQLPLCEEDFKGFTYFDNKDMLLIGPHSHEFNVPEFPDKIQTLTMAVRAFGLAWLYYEARYDEGIKVSEGWREVLALDGLRVAFLEANNREAVDKVCQHFFGTWLEDWEDRLADYGLVEPFVANFRETAPTCEVHERRCLRPLM